MGRKVYSEEFKQVAVNQVVVQRHTMKSVATRLGVSYETLRKCIDVARYGGTSSIIPADLPYARKIEELEKEVARLRMEREILIKATAFFAKENP